MASFAGRDFIIKLGASGAGGTLAAVTNLSLTINNEAVDITNKDSQGWRLLLEGAGTQSITLSGDGISSDGSTFETFKGYAQANSINTFYITDGDGDDVELAAQITSFAETGGTGDRQTFSFTLESSGVPTFTNA